MAGATAEKAHSIILAGSLERVGDVTDWVEAVEKETKSPCPEREDSRVLHEIWACHGWRGGGPKFGASPRVTNRLNCGKADGWRAMRGSVTSSSSEMTVPVTHLNNPGTCQGPSPPADRHVARSVGGSGSIQLSGPISFSLSS